MLQDRFLTSLEVLNGYIVEANLDRSWNRSVAVVAAVSCKGAAIEGRKTYQCSHLARLPKKPSKVSIKFTKE